MTLIESSRQLEFMATSLAGEVQNENPLAEKNYDAINIAQNAIKAVEKLESLIKSCEKMSSDRKAFWKAYEDSEAFGASAAYAEVAKELKKILDNTNVPSTN